MEKQFKFTYQAFAQTSELSKADHDLCGEAREACGRSYAPFSKFRVGAAARLKSGRVLTAANQESEVLPAGLCAERILLAQWQSNFAGDPIEIIAIVSAEAPVSTKAGEKVCSPCGICRQTLLDCERRQKYPIRVVMCGASSVYVVDSAEKLLPFAFSL